MADLFIFLLYSLLNGLVFIGELFLSTDAFFIVSTITFVILIYRSEKEEIDEMLIEDERSIV